MDDHRALEIIGSLADGTDPLTGEVFPDVSPYQRGDTIRALARAMEALALTARWREKRKALPERAGKPWDDGETEALIRRFDEGYSIIEIAREHRRTRGAIENQLARLGKISFSDVKSGARRQA
ncbi:MAG: hypothetical protein RDV48_29120 [Candidatus Eremiobacteraeota bacterium]|nr:hypothetical protein [Candidatus Eremiobacteraeota bacterium]